MIQTLPVETAKRKLDSIVEQLGAGDTITLTGASGEPVAVLVSLKSSPAIQPSDWQSRWDVLVEDVSASWKTRESALEVLREMRR